MQPLAAGVEYHVVGIDPGIVNLGMLRLDCPRKRVTQVIDVSLMEDHEADSAESSAVRERERRNRLQHRDSEMTVADLIGLLTDAMERPEIAEIFSGGDSLRAVVIEQQRQSRNSRQMAIQHALVSILKQRLRTRNVPVVVVPASAVKRFFCGSVFNPEKRHAPGVTKRMRYRLDKKSAVDYGWSFFTTAQKARLKRKRDDVCDALLLALYYYLRIFMRQPKFVLDRINDDDSGV